MYRIYNAKGFDEAVENLASRKINLRWKNGLLGELVFYDRCKEYLKLVPTNDLEKADFYGFRSGHPTFFDVTTNVSCKNLDEYLEYIKKGKQYEIVIVNPKTFEIEFFPLRFPVCKNCGNFSHFIFYLHPPPIKKQNASGSSGSTFEMFTYQQEVLQYCAKCDEHEPTDEIGVPYWGSALKPVKKLHFKILSPVARLKQSTESYDRNARDLKQKGRHIVGFAKRASDRLISCVAENERKSFFRDEKYNPTRLLWRHPLAKDITPKLSIPFCYDQDRHYYACV